jgi:hypothetical protein
MCIINIITANYIYWRYLICCIFHPVKPMWLGWWLGEFPYEHFHHRPIYLIILQAIRISPPFKYYLHFYIYNFEIFFFPSGTYPNLVVFVSVFSGCFFVTFCSTLVHLILWIINFNVQLSLLMSLTLVLLHNLLQSMVFFFILQLLICHFFFTIIDILWFRGQPYHPMIHQLF